MNTANRIFFSILIVVSIAGTIVAFVDEDTTGITTPGVCEVYQRTYGRTGSRACRYFVAGTAYTCYTGRGYTGATIGDLYTILYDSLQPARSRWVADIPLLTKAEPQTMVTGEVGLVQTGTAYDYIEYTYKMNGTRFTRGKQVRHEDSIGAGARVDLYVSIRNPQRAMLYARHRD